MIDNFCVIQHLFAFQRPFSSTFNTAAESSYLYGTTQFGAIPPHHGVEILNPTGTPVLAVEDGTIVVAVNDAHRVFGLWESFYGNFVVIEHHLSGIDVPIYTLYGHLSIISVEIGATGGAIGSHLHFKVREEANLYDNTRNPALWLSPRMDENGQQLGALAGKFYNLHGNHIYFTIKTEYYPDVNEEPEQTFFHRNLCH
jgi:murein DD-endopeptidase MepM/ murein hydrolase activator NlpD